MAPIVPTDSAAPAVLVLGRDDRSFLSVVRSLGRLGLEVHVAWHAPDSLAVRSRYISKQHTLPRCDPPKEGWREALLELLERETFQWVIPTNDPTTMALFEMRDVLPGYVHSPTERTVEIAFDKLATWKLARDLGIPVPEQRCVRSTQEGENALAEFGFPLVLKPRLSFKFGRRKWEHLVRKAYDREQLDSYLTSLLEDGDVLAQRNVIGNGIGIEVLADEGKVLFAFQHERLHEPLMGGGSSYRRSAPVDPELLAATEQLAQAIELSGAGMFEYSRNPRSGTWVLIEINARFWGSLPLALASGADFPAWLYRLEVLGQPSDYRARTGVYARNWWMDFVWLQFNARANREDPTLHTMPWRTILFELRNVLFLRERSDLLVLDDLRPGLGEQRRLAREACRMLNHRLRTIPLRSRTIRRVRARRLKTAVERAHLVLFVCKGNICRSPFAAALARRALPASTRVLSAGYHSETGRPCPRESVHVAARYGIDLSEHRSRGLDSSLLDRADVVLVMDEANEASLRARWPQFHKKVHRLGLMNAESALDIKDPYGRAYADFELACGHVAEALVPLGAEARTLGRYASLHLS